MVRFILSRWQIALLLLMLFPMSLTEAATGNTQSTQTSNQPILEVGTPLQKRIGGGESHSYTLALNIGQFVQLQIDQRGVDVIVRLFDSEGVQKAEMDSPNGAHGPELLCFIPEKAGSYRVEVRQLQADAIVGNYTILVTDIRALEAADRSRFEAQQIFSEAEQLRNQGKVEVTADAIAKYEAAVKLYSDLKDPRGSALCMYGLGAVHQNVGQNLKALEDYEQSAQLWREANDSSARANTLNSLGLVCDELGRKEESLAYYNRALVIFRTIGDKREIANTLANVGKLNVSLGRHATALRLFNESLKVFQALGQLRESAAILTNLSVVQESLGNYDEAIARTTDGLQLQRRLGDKKGEAYALVSIANVHFALGSFGKALATYGEALIMFQESGNRSLEGQTLNNIGKCYLMLGDTDRALSNISRALELARAVGDRNRQAYYLNNIALLQPEPEGSTEAERIYKEALAIVRDVRNAHGEAQILDNLASLYISAGRKNEALDSLRIALSINRTLNEIPEEGTTLANLMFAWKSFQQPSLAILYGKEAINRFQQIRSRIRTLERGLQASYLTSKERVYRELANMLIGQGRLAEAQQVLHMLKEEEYFQFIRRSANQSPNETQVDFTPEEAEWENRYKEISNRIAEIGRERGALRQKQNRSPVEEQRLNQLEHDLEIANQRFQSFLDDLHARFANAPGSNFRIAALRDTQAMQSDLRELGPGTIALFTVVADENYNVIVVTPDAQIAREYPIKVADLNQKISEFRQLLQQPDSDPRPLAQELYRILVGPIAEDLKQAKAKTLMWSLDGALRYLPLNALHDGSGYLVERYKNIVFTLASHAHLKDPPKPSWRGLGLGVSKAVENFPALAGVPLELSSIIRAPELQRSTKQPSVGVVPGKILMDTAFTLTAMRNELRQRYPLVHIASHFLFKPGNENDSFLLLGNGQHLTLAEIKRAVTFFDGVDLLTLSACDTATGGVASDGKEMEGFAVMAQRQGAKSVIASLWPVSDNSTRMLMQEFYKLRVGALHLSKAEALRRAQISLLTGKSPDGPSRSIKLQNEQPKGAINYSHPFFWAPFILVGNWR